MWRRMKMRSSGARSTWLDARPPPRLKRFDVLWAATAARAGDLNNAWTLESLERAAKDVRAALAA